MQFTRRRLPKKLKCTEHAQLILEKKNRNYPPALPNDVIEEDLLF